MSKIYVGVLSVAVLSSCASQARTQQQRRDLYADRYRLPDILTKKTDNEGTGFEELYGTRNFRKTLEGVLYRGGSNNVAHREHRRGNQNPLPQDGIENLCREGFTQGIYLYEANFSSAPKEVQCTSRITGKRSTFRYSQIKAFDDQGIRDIHLKIYEHLRDPGQGPVYSHCWNGWHASGFVAATSLMQFCGWSAKEAVAYWDRGTDGNNRGSGYESIRQRIRNFKVSSDLQLDARTQSLLCPSSKRLDTSEI